MNYLLLLYLNLIRGPRIMEERRAKEETARVAHLEAERAAGRLELLTCKKCDGEIDVRTAARADRNAEPQCAKCRAEERARRAAAVVVPEERMTPFLWFQLFVMLAGIVVFVHRNYMPLF